MCSQDARMPPARASGQAFICSIPCARYETVTVQAPWARPVLSVLYRLTGTGQAGYTSLARNSLALLRARLERHDVAARKHRRAITPDLAPPGVGLRHSITGFFAYLMDCSAASSWKGWGATCQDPVGEFTQQPLQEVKEPTRQSMSGVWVHVGAPHSKQRGGRY